MIHVHTSLRFYDRSNYEDKQIGIGEVHDPINGLYLYFIHFQPF